MRGLEAVLRYHERSSHRPDRFAPGPGRLDWANQPEPFRSWAGAPRIELPLAGHDLPASWSDLHRPGAVAPRPLGRASLGAFFELALGLTAWKEHGGARWALRANPSSGNLHPTEGYLLVAETDGIPAGLYHYLSRDHVLERRWTPHRPGTLARLLPRRRFPPRPRVHPLARGVEVRRAGLPLLPARRGPRARCRPLRGGGAGLVRSPPRRTRRRRRVGAPGSRSRE